MRCICSRGGLCCIVVVVTDHTISVETSNLVHWQDIPPYSIHLYSQAHEIITGPISYHGTHFNLRYKIPLQTSNFKHFTLILQSKYKKTGDTYAMAYGGFIFGIAWANGTWCLPTFPQICLLSNSILISLTRLSISYTISNIIVIFNGPMKNIVKQAADNG